MIESKKVLNKKKKKTTFIVILIIKIIILILLLYYLLNEINKNIGFHYSNINIKNKIKIGVYAPSLKNGGIERFTSLLLFYLNKVPFFQLILFTSLDKQENEYEVNENIERIVVKKSIFELLNEKQIQILIYQFYNFNEIYSLNNLTNTKTIFINHSCFLHWFYYKLFFYLNNLYTAYKSSNYIISLVPFENDYLFKKWGITSILMNNFNTYDIKSITPSDLSSNIILMIGRGNDPIKRFGLGIYSMVYIVKEIPNCEMKIISNKDNINNLIYLVSNFNLMNNINFEGYKANPSIYFKNASLHLFPTLVESFGNVLSETLIYGIPNIVCGLDYVSLSKRGIVIIYDDSPITIAKEAIKILKNKLYRKNLGREGRKIMLKYKNEKILERWIKLILSVYKGKNYYENFRNNDKKISEKKARMIISNQLKLLQMRNEEYKNITINDIENFTFIENYKK